MNGVLVIRTVDDIDTFAVLGVPDGVTMTEARQRAAGVIAAYRASADRGECPDPYECFRQENFEEVPFLQLWLED